MCFRISFSSNMDVKTARPYFFGDIGNAECVKLVLAKGASLEAYDLYNGTPLHVACANQQLECVRVLLNAGAKVNAARLHETALHHAAKASNAEMIELLVEFGANVYAKDKHEKRPGDYTQPTSSSALLLQLYESGTKFKRIDGHFL
ncbi:hypothetical protein P4O66_002300 [Electrophorus voltai]|uniref:Uncharacterized protein n=1 Tax=Electrophorus voltai TaxID=2609070 RepID=A0AAD8Z1U6_9TELE|nr:hypothetical protein P4O66_002300 [Electrophorus voltai]